MKNWIRIAALPGLALALAACGGKPQPASDLPAPAATPAAQEAPVLMPRTPAPAGAMVTLISPVDGATVKSPFTAVFAIEGMTLAPAGINDPNTGHHHILIDTGLPPLDQPIPKDANHLHFGQAQTEGQVELPPGQHTLQLLLADGNHLPHDPPIVSGLITIMVE